jgi:hypothetical protein
MTRPRRPILAIAAILCSVAFADDLKLGSNYNVLTIDENNSPVTVGGGAVLPSYLDGYALPYVYCVGLFTDVYVPDDYPDTLLTNNGVVNGAMINNAGEIAWLIDNYGVAAEGNQNDQEALQAAIWTVEYDNTSVTGEPVVTGDSGQSYYSQEQTDLNALGSKTAALSTITWMSPGNGSGTEYQGLITTVPEPMSILLFGTMLVLIVGLMKAKKTRSKV